MIDHGQPKTIIPHFTLKLYSLEFFFRRIQTNFLNYQIFSQDKKGSLNSEITPQIFHQFCSLMLASLYEIQNKAMIQKSKEAEQQLIHWFSWSC